MRKNVKGAYQFYYKNVRQWIWLVPYKQKKINKVLYLFLVLCLKVSKICSTLNNIQQHNSQYHPLMDEIINGNRKAYDDIIWESGYS